MSCYARDDEAPVTMNKCMDLPYNLFRMAATYEGELPRSRSTVSTVLGPDQEIGMIGGIRAASAVDCFVEVAGSQYVLLLFQGVLCCRLPASA